MTRWPFVSVDCRHSHRWRRSTTNSFIDYNFFWHRRRGPDVDPWNRCRLQSQNAATNSVAVFFKKSTLFCPYGTGWQPPVPFFLYGVKLHPPVKNKKKFIKIIDNIKIAFLIIDFFHTDYQLDRFFSHDQFRLKSIAEFSKIDITTRRWSRVNALHMGSTTCDLSKTKIKLTYIQRNALLFSAKSTIWVSHYPVATQEWPNKSSAFRRTGEWKFLFYFNRT